MIRNPKYIQHLREINVLAEKLDDTLDSLPGCSDNETMEETEIRCAIYRAAEKLNDAKRAIEHFTKATKEGTLKKNDLDRYEIHFKKGESHSLSCGSSLEVYLKDDREEVEREEGWYSGSVEHSDGYYFRGPGNPKLKTGMKVRIRI